MNQKINLYSIPVDTLSGTELTGLIDQHLSRNHPLTVYNINVHAFNLFFRRSDFAETIRKADIVICDSDIIRVLLRFFEKTSIEKLTGSRWVPEFFKNTQHKKLKVFLLGDEYKVLEICKRKFEAEFPSLTIGFFHGFFPESEEKEVIERVNAFQADVLLVAMGMPKQELFLTRNHESLNPVIRIPVGGAFRYWAEIHTQAPDWILKLNLEWLHRIYLEPGRLTGRYVRDAFWFVLNLILRPHQNSGRTKSK